MDAVRHEHFQMVVDNVDGEVFDQIVCMMVGTVHDLLGMRLQHGPFELKQATQLTLCAFAHAIV
eukprot:4852218-Prymnesium_polylepis.1